MRYILLIQISLFTLTSLIGQYNLTYVKQNKIGGIKSSGSFEPMGLNDFQRCYNSRVYESEYILDGLLSAYHFKRYFYTDSLCANDKSIKWTAPGNSYFTNLGDRMTIKESVGKKMDSTYVKYNVKNWYEVESVLPDTTVILGYHCKKATLIKINTEKRYFAYYTPELGVPGGPEDFGYLPGLILKVESEDGLFIIVAQKITIDNSISIKLPDFHGKEILTPEENLRRNRMKYEEKVRAKK